MAEYGRRTQPERHESEMSYSQWHIMKGSVSQLFCTYTENQDNVGM